MKPARPTPTRAAPRAAIAAALTLLSLAGCERERPAPAPAPGPATPSAPSPGPSRPSPAPAPAPGAAGVPTFVEIAEEAGISVVNHTGKPEQKDWIISAMGGGTIALDYDNDGDMDLCVVDGTMLTAEGVLELHDDMRTRLFRNDTNGGPIRFTEVTKEAGIDIRAFGFGGAACDYDADGFTDFFVACWGRNYLMRNRGDGTFEDATAKAGVAGDDRDMSSSCSWGDVDGDGIHDLYVPNYCDQQALIDEFRRLGKRGRSATWREIKVYVGPSPIPPQKDRLYLGNGDGTFREVTDTNLLSQVPLYSFTSVMSDFDNDGDLDIVVANDTQSNHLWVNDGKGVFRDQAVAASVAMNQDSVEQACMGVDVADYDRDGWMDVTITNFSHDYNTIYLNRTKRSGVLVFTDSSNVLGIAQPSYHRLAWGVKFVDFDNDGWLDHVSACGHVYGEIDGFEKATQTSYRQRCQILRNGGPPAYRLSDVTDAAGPAFQVKRVWRGICFGDYDDDGDADMYVAALNDRSGLFRNDGGNRNSWVRFRLVGQGGQRDPAGARVHVTMADGTVQVAELHHGDSFLCDNDPRMIFGLGAMARVPKVEVAWRDGTRQTFTDVEARRAWTVVKGQADLVPDGPAKR